MVKRVTNMALNPKNFLKKRFDVSKWIGSDTLKENALMIKALASSNLSAKQVAEKKQAAHMSFEELIQLHRWSASDIKKNKAHQKHMIFGFIGFSGILLAIAIYLFIISNIFGGVFTLVFMLLSLAYAYQSWVSFEQLKQHKIRINVKASFLSLFKK
jgi:hypothetical protein